MKFSIRRALAAAAIAAVLLVAPAALPRVSLTRRAVVSSSSPAAAVAQWLAGAGAPFRAFVPTLHAQNAYWLQGPLTITNMTVVQPYLCGDTGTCPGTPSWASSSAVDGAQIVTESGAVRYRYDSIGCATTCTGPTTTVGMLANGGTVITIQQIGNTRQLRMIATTSTNASAFLTVVRS